MRLPWHGKWVPHAMLDVGRPCNIACPGCYNGRPGGFKSLEQLDSEVRSLLEHRKLQTITLSGGEPTLHPEIEAVVELIGRRGLKVGLLTNGTRLTTPLLAQLRGAGLSVVLLHIQPGQQRPDIAANADPMDWRQLRAAKAKLVTEAGLVTGVSWIARKSRLAELAEVAEEVMSSSDLDFLLVTGYRDFRRFGAVTGSVSAGLQIARPWKAASPSEAADEIESGDLIPILKRSGLSPFGGIGSSHDPQSLRWVTALVAVARKSQTEQRRSSLRPGLSDAVLGRVIRRLTGRSLFFFKPSIWQFRVQLGLNACTGGRPGENLRLLLLSFRGWSLQDKHVVLQSGPTLHNDGQIEFCDNCPDAVWQGDTIVPVCLSDRMASDRAAHEEVLELAKDVRV